MNFKFHIGNHVICQILSCNAAWNLSELGFLYRFPLQGTCCDSGHPEASVMSAEYVTILTSQVLVKIRQWKSVSSKKKGIECLLIAMSQHQQDIETLPFIFKSPLHEEIVIFLS